MQSHVILKQVVYIIYIIYTDHKGGIHPNYTLPEWKLDRHKQRKADVDNNSDEVSQKSCRKYQNGQDQKWRNPSVNDTNVNVIIPPLANTASELYQRNQSLTLILVIYILFVKQVIKTWFSTLNKLNHVHATMTYRFNIVGVMIPISKIET